MQYIKYFVRNYKYDFLAGLFAILSGVVGFIYYDKHKVYLLISIFLVLILLIVIIYLRLKEKDFYFISFQSRNHKKYWMGKGDFDYSQSEKSFFITHSSEGLIFSKCLNWSNYQVTFKFKIINKCIGIVLRAVNLSNYVMLQCNPEGINPHVKINALWFIQRYSDKDVKLDFSKPLSRDKWYKCVFACENRIIKIIILENKKIIFNREWIIPDVKTFTFKEREDGDEKQMVLPVNLDYGTVGFRNYGSEKALIKDFLIEKI